MIEKSKNQLGEGVLWSYIWLPDGKEVFDTSSEPYLFMRIAIISDSDGYGECSCDSPRKFDY